MRIDYLKIKDCFRIVKGRKLENIFEDERPGSKRYLQIEDLRGDGFLKYALNGEGVAVNPKDVIIAWDGAYAGLIQSGLSGFIGSTLAKLEPITDKIYTPYGTKFLQSQFDFIKENRTGATIPHIKRDFLENLKIPIFSLVQQEKIANILSRTEFAIEKRRETLRLADEFLKSVFIDMFGDPSRNDKKWPIFKIGDVLLSSQYGTSKKSNTDNLGSIILGMGNIGNNGEINLSKVNYVDLDKEEFEKLKLVSGDIIFNRTNSTELVGKTACWRKNEDAVLASYLVKLKLKQDVVPEFFAFLLNTAYFKNIFMQRCKKAVGQSNISPTLLKEFEIFVPPKSDQQKFADLVQKVEALKEKQKQSESELQNLFNCLMQKAFKGELF